MVYDKHTDDQAGITAVRGESAGGPPLPIGVDELWSVLTAQPGVGVALVDGSGVVEFANGQVEGLWAHEPGVALVGRPMQDIFPAVVAQERLGHVRRAIDHDEVIVERVMWGGVRVQATYQAVGSAGGVLIVVIRGRHPAPAGAQEVDAAFTDLGPLDSLSPRELEVLAHLGQGTRIKEIAKIMERSPKTIQNHRESIGHKLRVNDRVSLARIAREAGLEPGDAYMVRANRS